MLINLRGTSGSGKTTVMRSLMEKAEQMTYAYVSGRKRPAYTVYKLPNNKTFAVMGHYETACGGCDTINKLDDAYEWMRQAIETYKVDAVVAEGLLLGKDVKRIVTMEDAHVIYIDTPIELCYEGVRRRRWAKVIEKYGSVESAPKDVVDKMHTKPKALENDHKGILSAVNRLRDKVTVHDATRETALDIILDLLK